MKQMCQRKTKDPKTVSGTRPKNFREKNLDFYKLRLFNAPCDLLVQAGMGK
jgi:hypothetical protein